MSGPLGAPIGPIDIKHGVAISVNLSGQKDSDLVGYKAKPHTSLIDVDKIGVCAIGDYWDPVYNSSSENGRLILNPDEFYILMSKEYVSVPLDYAAEMRAYDTKVGEFRVHYAGFFDPGFGHAASGGQGTRAVLEVRSHDVPFLIEDGQTVCRLIYEQMTQIPEKIYGAGGIGSLEGGAMPATSGTNSTDQNITLGLSSETNIKEVKTKYKALIRQQVMVFYVFC